MKTIFIGAEAEVNVIPVLKKALKKLPEKIGLVSSVQYVNQLNEAKKFLEQNGKKVELGGQVLGCNVTNAEKLKSDCILFLGSGNFHAIEIAKVRKIVNANPFTNDVSAIDEKAIEKIEKRRKGAFAKFLSVKNIGVIMSAKKGQFVEVNRKMLEKKYADKQFFYFLTDTLSLDELENFPFVQCWVNTMCPRIAYEDITEKTIVNFEDI